MKLPHFFKTKEVVNESITALVLNPNHESIVKEILSFAGGRESKAQVSYIVHLFFGLYKHLNLKFRMLDE